MQVHGKQSSIAKFIQGIQYFFILFRVLLFKAVQEPAAAEFSLRGIKVCMQAKACGCENFTWRVCCRNRPIYKYYYGKGENPIFSMGLDTPHSRSMTIEIFRNRPWILRINRSMTER